MAKKNQALRKQLMEECPRLEEGQKFTKKQINEHADNCHHVITLVEGPKEKLYCVSKDLRKPLKFEFSTIQRQLMIEEDHEG